MNVGGTAGPAGEHSPLEGRLASDLQKSLESSLKTVVDTVNRDVAGVVGRAQREAARIRAEADEYASAKRAEADRKLAEAEQSVESKMDEMLTRVHTEWEEVERLRHAAARQLDDLTDRLADISVRVRAVPDLGAELERVRSGRGESPVDPDETAEASEGDSAAETAEHYRDFWSEVDKAAGRLRR